MMSLPSWDLEFGPKPKAFLWSKTSLISCVRDGSQISEPYIPTCARLGGEMRVASKIGKPLRLTLDHPNPQQIADP